MTTREMIGFGLAAALGLLLLQTLALVWMAENNPSVSQAENDRPPVPNPNATRLPISQP